LVFWCDKTQLFEALPSRSKVDCPSSVESGQNDVGVRRITRFARTVDPVRELRGRKYFPLSSNDLWCGSFARYIGILHNHADKNGFAVCINNLQRTARLGIEESDTLANPFRSRPRPPILPTDAQAGFRMCESRAEPRPEGKKKAASRFASGTRCALDESTHWMGLLDEVSLSERAVIQGTTQTGLVPTLKREVGRQVVISGKEVSRWQSQADDAKAAPGASLVRKLPMLCFN
jgi:hypothetical protein